MEGLKKCSQPKICTLTYFMLAFHLFLCFLVTCSKNYRIPENLTIDANISTKWGKVLHEVWFAHSSQKNNYTYHSYLLKVTAKPEVSNFIPAWEVKPSKAP